MKTAPESSQDSEHLQFDQVQYSPSEGEAPAPAQPGASCGGCSRMVVDTYYEAGGKVLCPDCKTSVEASLTGGSRLARVIRALLYGGVVAVVVSAVYYGVREISGYELALIAIVLGWGVGTAVHRGARGRGGWFYQFAAVLLTYASISFSYVPDIVTGLLGNEKEAEVELADGAPAGQALSSFGPAPLQASEAESSSTATVVSADELPAGISSSGTEEGAPPSPAAILMLGLVLAVGFTLSVPVVMCTQSPIYLLIYGFGLLQAWQMNRKLKIAISGPFYVQAPLGALPPLPGQTPPPPPSFQS